MSVIDGTCPNIEIIAESARDQELLSKVFEQNTRVNLENTEGLDRYLTYSFDAELETPSFIRFILSEPEGAALLNKLYGEYTIDYACKVLKLSPAQLKSFALNTGVDKTKSAYVFSDFRLKYIVDLVNAGGRGAKYSLINIIQEIAHQKQRTLEVGDDSDAIEVRDPSFRDTPRAIKNIVQALSEDFVTPQLHLHLGLAHDVISEQKAIAIARAIETVLVLGRAAKEPGTYQVDDAYLNQGSPLAMNSKRGAVYLKPAGISGAFQNPFLSHDLEIRKADSDEQQLQFLALGIVLAKNHERLLLDDSTYGAGAVDTNLGNLKGALLYTAKLFEQSNIDDNKRMAPLLQSLARKITFDPNNLGYYNPSPELAEEIFQFLNDKQIVQRLTTNLFLKP